MGTKIHAPPAGGYLVPNPSNAYTDRRATGNVWYVSSGTAGATDNAAFGLSPEAPFASIAFALTQAKVNNDDVIVALPGHVETVGAAGLNVNVAGLTIRGEIAGGTVVAGSRARGQITFSNAGGSVNVSAANVTLDNLSIVGTGVAGVAALVTVSAADCVIQNCELELANATNQAVLGISTTAAANRMLVQNCHLHGTNNAGLTAAIQLVGGSDTRIQGNDIIGSFGAAVGGISNITTAATNLLLYSNTIVNLTAANTKAFTALAGTTGYHQSNFYGILSGTAPFTAAGMYTVSNVYASAVNTAVTAC